MEGIDDGSAEAAIIYRVAKEWADARKAVLDAQVHDVRVDPTYRDRLDRLAKAEHELYQEIMTR
jgi:hypothetical protein